MIFRTSLWVGYVSVSWRVHSAASRIPASQQNTKDSAKTPVKADLCWGHPEVTLPCQPIGSKRHSTPKDRCATCQRGKCCQICPDSSRNKPRFRQVWIWIHRSYHRIKWSSATAMDIQTLSGKERCVCRLKMLRKSPDSTLARFADGIALHDPPRSSLLAQGTDVSIKGASASL